MDEKVIEKMKESEIKIKGYKITEYTDECGNRTVHLECYGKDGKRYKSMVRDL